LYRSIAPNGANAGFTLIEVLVALSIVSIALSSIGSLIASTARGTRSIEAHLSTVEAARAIIAALPDRDQIALGATTGEMAHQQWRVEVSPFSIEKTDRRIQTPWVPQTIVASVLSPTGVALQISTVRLQRVSAR
jgi:general secretion pathway protein I